MACAPAVAGPPRSSLRRPFPLAACALAPALGLLSSPPLAEAEPPDPHLLPALLARRGFTPPASLKALVLAPDRDGVGAAHDYCATSDDRGDWWPASSVKIFAAIAALETSRARGYPPEVWVRYHYDQVPDAPDDARSRAWRLSGIVHRAIAPSSNADFDRLVELVGFDAIHRSFFTAGNGLAATVLRRAYTGRLRDEESGLGIFRDSPPITLYLGRRKTEIPARPGTLRPDCPDLGNCTTLANLAEAMRRVVFHERLPEDLRYDLGPDELRVLRDALAGERPRGNGLPEAVARGFGDDVPLRFLHKPGYALRWISEVMLVERTDTGRRWILAAAARPGRRALDGALEAIGQLLAAGALDEAAASDDAAALRAQGQRLCEGGATR